MSPHTPNRSPQQDLSFACSLPFGDFLRQPSALRDQCRAEEQVVEEEGGGGGGAVIDSEQRPAIGQEGVSEK